MAYRFAGGPPPWRPPARGTRARVGYEWREWRKGLLGWAAAGTMLGGGIWLIGDWERSQELVSWAGRLTLVLVIWLIGWPVWETLRLAGSGPPAGEEKPVGSDLQRRPG